MLLSTKDGSVIQQPHQRLHRPVREHRRSTTSFVAGRSIAFDPKGDTVAFFARSGQATQPRSWSRSSTARSCGASRSTSTRPQVPCLLPDGQHAIFAGPQGRRLGHLAARPRDGRGQEPDAGRVRRHRPPGLARRQARRLHAAASAGTTRSTSFPLDEPVAEDPAHLRRLRRRRARPSPPTARSSTTPRTRTTTSPTCGAWTSRPGSSSSTPTPWAATWRPPPSRASTGDRLAFISYFKGEYKLHTPRTRASP